ASPPAVGPQPPPGVAFVADYAVRPHPGSPAAGPLDRALLQQLLEHRGFVLLAGREQQRQELAAAFRPEMDLGREAALAAPERFRRRSPPLCPGSMLVRPDDGPIDEVEGPI